MATSTLWRHYYAYLSQLIDILGSLHSMTSLLYIFFPVNWYSWFPPLYDVIIMHLSQSIDILGYLHSMTSLLYIFIPVNWYSWFPPLYDVIIMHIYPSYLIFLVPSTLWRHYYAYLSQLIDIIGYLHSMTSLLCIFIPVNWYSWLPPLWCHYYTYLSQLIDILSYLHSMTSLLYIFIPVNWYSWFPPLYDVIIMHIYPS